MGQYRRENKQTLISVIQTHDHQEILLVIKQIVKSYLQKWDILELYMFFSEIYEELYHDFLSKKCKLEKKTLRILECLATPIYQKPFKEQCLLFEKLLK